MKQFMCLFLLVGLGSSILAMDLIEKRFEVDGTPHFDLSNISGSIDVMQGDSGEVVVSAKNPNPKIEVIFTQDGNHITVETKYPKHSRNIKGGVDFEVWLPQDSNVKLNSVSGNMSLEGIEGRLSFNNVSGDILLRQIAGDIRLNNVSGNMKVRDLGESDVDANTVSGDIEFSNVSLKSGHFEFNSVSGDIELWHGPDASYRVSGESLSGDMDIRGGIDGLSVTKSKYVGNRSLKGSFNGGDADIEFNSVSGDFTLGME